MANRRRPLVVVTRKLPDKVETRMCELFDTRLNLNDQPMSHADLVEAVKTAEVLVPTLTDRIDARNILLVGSAALAIATLAFGLFAHGLWSAAFVWAFAGVGSGDPFPNSPI